MKLKATLFLTAALSFGGAFAQASFSDVPAGHWAKDAVDKMAAKGCVIGFPDGTFRGNENLTRYQAALILARCLQDGATNDMSGEDLEVIKNAVQELSADLAALGVRVSDLEDNAASKDDVAALEERVTALEEGMDGMGGGASEGGDNEALADLAAQVEAAAVAADTANSRADELQAQVDDMMAGHEDLQAQVEDLAAATDETVASIEDLQAQIDDLAVASGDTEAVADLMAQVDENASSIVALNDLTVLLNEDILSLEDRVSALEAGSLGDDLSAARADLSGLTTRVSVVETRVSDLEKNVAGLGIYQYTVSGDFSVQYYASRVYADATGASGYNFDTDRLFGSVTPSTAGGALDTVATTALSSGYNADNGRSRYADFGTRDESATLAGSAAMTADNKWTTTGGNKEGYGQATASLKVVFGKDTKTAITPNTPTVKAPAVTGVKVEGVDVALGIDTIDKSGVSSSYASSSTAGAGLNFSIGGASILATANGNPLKFSFGVKPAIKFTDYIFDNDSNSHGSGFVAELDGSNVPSIGSLSPKLWVTYGSSASDTTGASIYYYTQTDGTLYVTDTNPDPSKAWTSGTTLAVSTTSGGVTTVTTWTKLTSPVFSYAVDTDKDLTSTEKTVLKSGVLSSSDNRIISVKAINGNDYTNVYWRGIRGTIAPLAGLTLGFSVLDEAKDVIGVGAGSTFDNNTVYGLDLKATNIAGSGWNATSEYAASNKASNTSASAFYVKANGTLGPIKVVDLNYRSVEKAFDGASFDGVATTTNTAPYALGKKGFGFLATASISGFDAKAYADVANNFSSNGSTDTQYGASVTGKVGMFNAGAYYDYRDDKDNTVTDATYRYGVNAGTTVGPVTLNAFFRQTFTKDVLVDSESVVTNTNAPTPKESHPTELGVTATASLSGFNVQAGFAKQEADYSATKLYVGADTNQKFGVATVRPFGYFETKSDTDSSTSTDNYTLLRGGVDLSTQVLDAFAKPQVFGYAHAWSKNFYGAGYTSSNVLYRLGVKLNSFLFDQSTLALYYAGENANNVQGDGTTTGLTTGFSNNLNGVYTEWNYQNINLAYGLYTNKYTSATGAAKTSNGQAFKIQYKVKF